MNPALASLRAMTRVPDRHITHIIDFIVHRLSFIRVGTTVYRVFSDPTKPPASLTYTNATWRIITAPSLVSKAYLNAPSRVAVSAVLGESFVFSLPISVQQCMYKEAICQPSLWTKEAAGG